MLKADLLFSDAMLGRQESGRRTKCCRSVVFDPKLPWDGQREQMTRGATGKKHLLTEFIHIGLDIGESSLKTSCEDSVLGRIGLQVLNVLGHLGLCQG